MTSSHQYLDLPGWSLSTILGTTTIRCFGGIVCPWWRQLWFYNVGIIICNQPCHLMSLETSYVDFEGDQTQNCSFECIIINTSQDRPDKWKSQAFGLGWCVQIGYPKWRIRNLESCLDLEDWQAWYLSVVITSEIKYCYKRVSIQRNNINITLEQINW